MSERHCRLVFREAVGMDVLKGLRLEPGVESAELQGNHSIQLRYRSDETGLDVLLPWLSARGLSAAGDLRDWIALRIGRYRDSVARVSGPDAQGWEAYLRRIYVTRQPRRLHGRRDERAQHWRKYLDRGEPS
jgi:hypothetical protein